MSSRNPDRLAVLLPDEQIPLSHSLLGVGALVLRELEEGGMSLTSLWHRLQENPAVGSLARLVLALDLLFAIGAVDLVDGDVQRTRI